jgi:predicted nucleic acid-binding protein
VPSLVDSNVLVYRHDPRFPRKQRIATELLAEHYGLEELVSEDFQHDRIYGTVRVRNPFLGDGAELSRPSG